MLYGMLLWGQIITYYEGTISVETQCSYSLRFNSAKEQSFGAYLLTYSMEQGPS